MTIIFLNQCRYFCGVDREFTHLDLLIFCEYLRILIFEYNWMHIWRVIVYLLALQQGSHSWTDLPGLAPTLQKENRQFLCPP